MMANITEKKRYWDAFGSSFPKGSASNFASWFSAIIADVPEESRGSVRFAIGATEIEGGGACAFIDLYYDRAETESEISAREHEDAEEKKRREEKEIELLFDLINKYGAMVFKGVLRK